MNLLYPNGNDNLYTVSDDTYQNLAIEELVDMIAVSKEEKELVRKVFRYLPKDETTVNYRQEIFRDMFGSQEFIDELGLILNKLDVLKEFNLHNHFMTYKKASLWDLVNYMSEMDIYIQVVEELNILFEKFPMTSTGLKEIANLLKDVIDMDQIAEAIALVVKGGEEKVPEARAIVQKLTEKYPLI